MTIKLSSDLREAINRQGSPLEIEDDETKRIYVLVDGDLHERAMQALEEIETRRAIQAGIDDLEAGRVVDHSEVDAKIRKKLGLCSRSA